jgi:ubiquinone/menaquinone biosynthesis C-methylase UbiE
MGYKIVCLGASIGGYIDAKATVQAAQARGQTVCEYVETLWGQQGATRAVVEEMNKAGCLTPCKRVLEIGPGTGRYLELVAQKVLPQQYDIYETADDWATWLEKTYSPPVVRQPADGRSLRQTPDKSCGLVHAHGVFVYLSFLHCFEYFLEMMRVCMRGGWIVFDFFSPESFDEAMVMRWLEFPDRYPVVLPSDLVYSFFTRRGYRLEHEFDNPHGHGFSHYVIFKNIE